MKRLLVGNVQPNTKWLGSDLITLLKAQIHNSIELGWNRDDLLILVNFDFDFMDVKPIKIPMNSFCLTGSKMFAIQWVFNNGIDDVVWSADLDVWQNVPFQCPEFNDVGVTEYSRPKINGGSIFWKKQAIDIINEVVGTLDKDLARREEPTLNRVLRKYLDRVTTLNYTYNVGCSGYIPRYTKSIKPVHAFHFHPNNGIAWETHVLDRAGLGVRISERLEKLIRIYYPNLATELSLKGKRRREEKLKEKKNGKK